MLPHPILIIAATEPELAPVKGALGDSAEELLFATTGVGKTSAAIETTELIRELSPGWIIQTGCSGASPSSELGIADVGIANVEIFADEGVETPTGFLSLKDLGLPQLERDGELIFNEVPVHPPGADTLEVIRSAVSGQCRVETARFGTVSLGTGTDAASHRIEENWGALLESMEGAAAALAAWKQGVRFSEIRGVSNLTGDRDRENWKIDEACEAAALVALAWIETEKARA